MPAEMPAFVTREVEKRPVDLLAALGHTAIALGQQQAKQAQGDAEDPHANGFRAGLDHAMHVLAAQCRDHRFTRLGAFLTLAYQEGRNGPGGTA